MQVSEMSLVHHFIFNELQEAIRRSVPPVNALLDSLCQHGLIREDDKEKYSDKRKGIRRLISKLRKEDFETFVVFVSCILEAAEKSSAVKATIVNSIRGAAEYFDEHNGTHFKTRIPQNGYDANLMALLQDEDSDEEVALLPATRLYASTASEQEAAGREANDIVPSTSVAEGTDDQQLASESVHHSISTGNREESSLDPFQLEKESLRNGMTCMQN